jgi:Phosphotransferase enzyme family
VRQLAGVIGAGLGVDADLAVLRAIHGDVDADEISASVELWCREYLAADVVDAWLWRVSVGCVCGVRVDDGRDVVIKVYSTDRSAERITRVLDAQRHAATAGIPAAAPISGPRPLALGLATAETALLVGRPAVFTHELDRRTAIRGWYALSRAFAGREDLVADGVAWSAHPTLYPPPHSPAFDFPATADGAEWIDALACAARDVIDAHEGALMVVHNDWRADNIRLTDEGTGMAAVFDWDSLTIDREVTALGTVAAMHSVDWSGPQDPYFATAPECVEFIRTAEDVRGMPFTPDEWRTAKASILYGWCYTARCEHARAAVGHDDRRFGMRARLRADGATLLT